MCKTVLKNWGHANLREHHNESSSNLKERERKTILASNFSKSAKLKEKSLLNDDQVQCKFCDQQLKHHRLTSHVRFKHPDEFFKEKKDMINCSQCNEKFSQQRSKIFVLNIFWFKNHPPLGLLALKQEFLSGQKSGIG